MADDEARDARPSTADEAPPAVGLEELRRLHPGLALRAGRFDPAALLVVWYLRRSFVPLLALGLVIVTLLGGLDEPVVEIQDPRSIMQALLTPWVGVAAAIVVRLMANVVGLLLAFPLTGWAQPADYRVGRSSGRLRAWGDRWQRTAAYRALRWTWPVRRLAAERLGRSGRWLLAMDRAWIVAGVVTVIAWMALLAVVGTTDVAAELG